MIFDCVFGIGIFNAWHKGLRLGKWRNWALFHFESLVWINFYPGAVRRSNSNFNEGVSFQPTANSRDGIDSSGFWNLYLMFDSRERPVGVNWLLKSSLTPNFARKEFRVPLMMCVRTLSDLTIFFMFPKSYDVWWNLISSFYESRSDMNMIFTLLIWIRIPSNKKK